MKKMNWQIILPNIRDAREQLEALESQIDSGNKSVEAEFEIALRHAYHHVHTA